MSSRWLSLIVLMVIIGIIVILDKHSWRDKLKHYGMTFLEGMVGGLIIDSIGVNAGYYYFPRQPLYSPEYWLIVIPCWGVFGLALNFLWSWVAKGRFIRGSLITIPVLFAFYEGTNLLTDSWVYTTPFWVIALGWIPLVYVFAACDHRREVVNKVDIWVKQCQYQPYKFGLQAFRVLLVVVMFPLLLVSITKAIRGYYKNPSVSITKYAIDYVLMRA